MRTYINKRYPLGLLLLLLATLARAGGITADAFSVVVGSTATVSVSINGGGSYSAFVFDVALPDGLTITNIARGGALVSSHSVSYQRQPDGTYRILGYSSKNEAGKTDGVLATLTVAADKKAPTGEKTMTISNCWVTPPDVEYVQDRSLQGSATTVTVAPFIVAKPSITFKNAVMTIATTTSGANIYYTLDGTEPSAPDANGTGGSLYYNKTVTLTGNNEVKALAYLDGYEPSETATARLNYFNTAKPVITVKAGVCSISCSTANSQIYYRLAATPTEEFDMASATLYQEQFTITENCFVQAIAVRELYNDSPMAVQGVYSYGNEVTMSNIALAGEEEGDIAICLKNRNAFSAVQMDVKLPNGLRGLSAQLNPERSDGHTLYYNMVESTNTAKIVIFSGANNNLVGDEGLLLNLHVVCDNSAKKGDYTITAENIVGTTRDAIDYFLDNATSTFSKDTYAQTAAKPVIEVSGDHVSLSTTTAGATIYYTLDGTYPTTTEATVYTSMFILERNATIRAIAVCDGMNMSEMSEKVVNTLKVETPVLKMQGNNAFTLSCKTPGADIHYTLDGTAPTEQSPLYEGLVVLTENCTLRAKAWKDGLLASDMLTKQIQSIGEYVYGNNVYLPLSGETVNVPVYLSSTEEYTAWIMDVKLPASIVLDGMTIGASNGHVLSHNNTTGNTWRVVCYSASNAALPQGALFNMAIHAADGATAGDVEIELQNTVMTTAAGTDVFVGNNSINATLSALSLNMADADFNALKAIYHALGGDKWTDKWDITSPRIIAENWPGVTFEGDRVVAINLQGQGLSGELPAEVFGLVGLQSLNLSRNNLTGDLGSIFTAMPSPGCAGSLVTLNLSNNKFEGDVYPIGNALPALQSLYLSSNRMSEVSNPLPTSLVQLDLSYQQISATSSYTLPQLVAAGASALPTVVCYNHKTQTYTAPDLTLTNGANPKWSARLYYTSGQMTCQFSGTLNEYDQPSGAAVQAQSRNTLSYGSAFVINLDYEMGDANFDDYVNTVDFQTVLNYTYGEYPTQKRLLNRAASNMYEDNVVNVQDMVLLIDKLLGQLPSATMNKPSSAISHQPSAISLKIEGSEIVLNSPVPVASLQMSLSGISERAIQWQLSQYGFAATTKNVGTSVNAIVYSMMRDELPAGRVVLGRIRTGEASIISAIAADLEANALAIAIGNVDDADGIEDARLPIIDNRPSENYNLNGQRVGESYKGITIINGNKYVKK